MEANKELDMLLSSVIASLHQPVAKATAWSGALAQRLVTSKSQLVDLLKADRSEKAAGRSGSVGWRAVISALSAADIVEVAWPMVEAKLTEMLDKSAAAGCTHQASSDLLPPLRWTRQTFGRSSGRVRNGRDMIRGSRSRTCRRRV